MPKTTIDENGYFLLTKKNVCGSPQIRKRTFVCLIDEIKIIECFTQCDLRCRAFSAYSHHTGAGSF